MIDVYVVKAACLMDDVVMGVYDNLAAARQRMAEVNANEDLRHKMDQSSDSEMVGLIILRMSGQQVEVVDVINTDEGAG